MKQKTIEQIIFGTALAVSIMGGVTIKAQNNKEEQAYQQTMRELYNPVGNGGALHSATNTANTLWPTDSNPSFNRLAIAQRNNPQRRNMYQRMDTRYKELLMEEER